MPELHLILADQALRTAIVEQLKLVAPEIPWRESTAMPAPFPAEASMIILDAPLADKKTIGILQAMREHGRKPKIFVLGEIEAETGLNDDLIAESFPKPLRLGHLLARVQFYLQAADAQGEPLQFGPFRLEPAARQITVERSGDVIRLTEKETHLLEYLGRSKEPVAREELLAAIWGYDARIDTHTLETHIYRLRRKLDLEGKDAAPIIVEQGAYYLAAPRPR